jgi:hypothetical protein
MYVIPGESVPEIMWYLWQETSVLVGNRTSVSLSSSLCAILHELSSSSRHSIWCNGTVSSVRDETRRQTQTHIHATHCVHSADDRRRVYLCQGFRGRVGEDFQELKEELISTLHGAVCPPYACLAINAFFRMLSATSFIHISSFLRSGCIYSLM